MPVRHDRSLTVAAQNRISSRDREGAVPRRFSEIACDLLARGHVIRFSAPGTSMQPTIRNGETIHVEPVRSEQVRRGDILVYRWERGVRAHRVTRIVAQASACVGTAPVFILRGDAAVEDEVVQANEILGRVVSLERDGRLVRLTGRRSRVWRGVRKCASRLKRYIAAGWCSVTAASRLKLEGD